MAGYLNDNAFSIGYIDSGHGEKLGLSEVALKNKAGVYLKATDADVGAAANDAGVGIPSSFSESWADVNLLDADGASAWPIVTFSYIYINTNLADAGVSGALAKAMLEFLLSDECQNSESGHLLEFGFQPLSSQLLTRCRDEVANLELDSHVTPFTFETSTDTTLGSGDYVISTKRQRWNSYILNGLTDAVDAGPDSLTAKVIFGLCLLVQAAIRMVWCFGAGCGVMWLYEYNSVERVVYVVV